MSLPHGSHLLQKQINGQAHLTFRTRSYANAAFETRETPQAPAAGNAIPITQQRPEWFPDAERDLLEGLDEKKLAQLLGPGAMLLRAGFLPGGELYWTAAVSDGSGIVIVAQSGTDGRPDTRARIAHAVAEHDLKISIAYLDTHKRRAAAGKLQELSSCGLSPDDFAEEFSKRVSASIDALASEELATLAMRLWDYLKAGMPAADRSNEFISRWETAEALLNEPTPNRGLVVGATNRATTEFIAAVEREWDLSGLAEHLQPDLDVVVQVDDELHAVPVAHLAAGGRELWRQVRSVRSTVSLPAESIQARFERAAGTAAAPALLSVSYFGENDPAGVAAIDLHHGQRNLAGRHGIDWCGAAETPPGTRDRPPGTRAVLLRAIRDGAFTAATVSGHGDAWKASVLLGDAAWDGGGAMLDGLEILLAPTCTLGRIAGSVIRDVEGFSVQLLLHRARAVLACRWPVQCQQAVHFANEFLAQYLALRREHSGDLTAARLRALALNRARGELLKDDGAFLNTACAFDLWGLA